MSSCNFQIYQKAILISSNYCTSHAEFHRQLVQYWGLGRHPSTAVCRRVERGRRGLGGRGRGTLGRRGGGDMRRLLVGPEPGGGEAAAAAQDRRHRADRSVRDHPGEQGVAPGDLQEGAAVAAQHCSRPAARGAVEGESDECFL